jgi:hypothetical protein
MLPSQTQTLLPPQLPEPILRSNGVGPEIRATQTPCRGPSTAQCPSLREFGWHAPTLVTEGHVVTLS